MSWRDDLQPASIGGVPIHVEGGEGTFGRRIQNHGYPLRDKSYPEDLGGTESEFTLQAFLLGDDLKKQRDSLIEVLQKEGVHVLVHPRLGAIKVRVGKCRWTFRKNNVEQFSIPCYRDDGNNEPQLRTGTVAAVREKKFTALEAVKQSFNSRFTLDNLPDFVGAENALVITDAFNKVKSVTQSINAGTQTIAGISRTIDGTISGITQQLNSPLTLISSVTGLVNQVISLPNSVSNVMSSYRQINSYWQSVDPVPSTTPSRQQQAQNQTALQTLFTATTAVETVSRITEMSDAVEVTSNEESPFDSADQAHAVRDELVADLSAIAQTADDEVYRAVKALQVALVQHVNAHGNNLPRVKTVQYNNTLPALVIAHQVHGNALRESDLVTRNNLAHPLFIEAGTELEVLNG